VTPCLPTACPIPDARTRILDRRQTEGVVHRNFYVVEVTHQPARGSSDGDAPGIKYVDLSCILRYVSPDELERFENERFRNEAKIETVAVRADAEELANRRLAKNGVGRGTHMTNGLGLGEEIRTRGRSRGRGRGRGRQPRATSQERLVDAEVDTAIPRDDELGRNVENSESGEGDEPQRIIANSETGDDESEEDMPAQISPGLARSAFVANSALPLSPVIPHRRSFAAPIPPYPFATSKTHSDAVDNDTASISSAAMQLRLEDDARGSTMDPESEASDRHRSKRRRTESVVLDQRAQSKGSVRRASSKRSSTRPEESESESSDKLAPARPSSQHAHTHHNDLNAIPDPVKTSNHTPSTPSPSLASAAASDTELYVVEAILEHYRDETGTKFYLVKWAGYEDSHDWLPEEELGSAAELVAEYMREYREKRKVKKKMARRRGR
jgi:hypothetical protein